MIQHVRIVYRTFGQDLEEVAKELDVFSEGRHPLFPGKTLDPRLTLRRPFATFYRQGEGPCDTYLVIGTLKRPETPTCPDIDAFYANCNHDSDAAIDRQVQVVKGFPAIASAIDEMLDREPKTSVGVRDHWDWWHANSESDSSGKPLLLAEGHSKMKMHCFIDDHIERDRAHIIDVRHADSVGDRVPFAECIGRWIFRRAFDAISDHDTS